MDDTLKLGAVVVTLVGVLGAVMGWLTKVLVPRLLQQFDAAKAIFLEDSKVARRAFIDALREERTENLEERRLDREAIMALGRAAVTVPVAAEVATEVQCAQCDYTGTQANVNRHRAMAHKE